MTAENIAALVISVLVVVYLFAALLYPEKF
jgi:K+-transporting ATPase KdpF subunit